MSRLSAETAAAIAALTPHAANALRPRLATVIPACEDRICVTYDHYAAVRQNIPTAALPEVVLGIPDTTFVTDRLADLFTRFVRDAPAAGRDRWIAAVGSGRLIDPHHLGHPPASAVGWSPEDHAELLIKCARRLPHLDVPRLERGGLTAPPGG